MEKKLKLINNILFYGAFVLGIFVMLKTYIDRSRLPEGVCPINNNQSLYYFAIILLLVSFIFNMILSIRNRKKKAS